MEQDQIPIACVLGALTPQQQAREAELLREHLASIQETKEREDGYSFRYPSDVSLFPRIAELVNLEHRCCPFLNFQLEWVGTQDSPWLHISGGTRVKPFVLSNFTKVKNAQ